MKTQSTIIKNTVNSIYAQSVMRANGWSSEYMKTLVIEFLTCGKSISFYDFIEANK